MRKTAKTVIFWDSLVDASPLHCSAPPHTSCHCMRKTTCLKVSYGNGTKCKSLTNTPFKSIIKQALVHHFCPKSTGPTKSALRVQSPKMTSPCSTAQVFDIMELKGAFHNSFNTIGNISGMYTIRTDPNILPIQHIQCKVPIEYQEQMKKMLDDMVTKGVIAPVSWPTEWVSSLT